MHSRTLRKLTIPLLAFAFALCLAPAFATADENPGGASASELTTGAIATMGDEDPDGSDDPDDPDQNDDIGYIESIEYHHDGTVELIEGIDGDWIPTEDGNGEWFRYNYENCFSGGLLAIGDTVEVTYSSGNVITYTYTAFTDGEDESSGWYSWADEGGTEAKSFWVNLSAVNEQSEDHPWAVGSTQTIRAYANGDEGVYDEVSVSIVANPVASISFEPVNPYEFIEDYDGEMTFGQWWDESANEWVYGEFFMYRWGAVHAMGNYAKGDTLTVRFADDDEKTYVFSESFTDEDELLRLFVNPEDPDDVIPGDEVLFLTDQGLENQWGVGNHSVTIEYQGRRVKVPVVINPNPVTAIQFTPGVATLENGVDGYTTESEGGDPWFYYCRNAREGDLLTVVDQDGGATEYEYSYVEPEGYCFANADATKTISCEEISFTCEPQSFDAQWAVGNRYDVSVSYMGRTTTFEAEITANQVSAIGFVPARNIQFMVGLDCWRDASSEGDEESAELYYCELSSVPTEGDVLVVTSISGDTVEYELEWFQDDEQDRHGLYYANAEKGLYIPIGDVAFRDTETDSLPWAVGSHSIEVTYHGVSTIIDAEVIDNPIRRISYTPVSTTLEYGMDGSYETDDGETWFSFSMYVQDGDRLTVETDDGSVEYECRYIEENEDRYFVSMDGTDKFSASAVQLSCNQSLEEPWNIGETHSVTVWYSGRETTFEVKIDGNSVSAIEYEPANSVTFTEGKGGEWRDERYDSETGERVSTDGWYYYPESAATQEGDKIIITSSTGDKTVYELRYYEDEEGWSDFRYISSDPDDYISYSDVHFDSTQDIEPWDVGQHEITVSYHGVSTSIPVELVANPVEKIEYKPVNLTNGCRIFISHYDAHEDYYCDDDDEIEYSYDYYSYDKFQLGDVLSVFKTDGTQIDYTYKYITGKEIDDNGYESTWESAQFVDADGNYISDEDIDVVDNQSPWHPWQLNDGNDKYITYKYEGRSCDVPVALIASPVERIEFTPAREYSAPENANGSWMSDESSDDAWFYYELPTLVGDAIDYPFHGGDTLTVHYNNGWDSKEYVYYGLSSDFRDKDGNTLQIGGNWQLTTESDQVENHWGIGEHSFMLSYGGASASVPFKVTENDVESISFTPIRPYELYEGKDGSNYDDDDDESPFEYYTYDFRFKPGDKLTVTRKGVSSEYVYTRRYEESMEYDEDYELNPESGEPAFVNVVDSEDIILASKVMMDDGNQSADNPWSSSRSDCEMTISYSGASCTVQVTILPFTITGIEYIPATDITVVDVPENYFDDWDWDEDTDAGIRWRHYQDPSFNEGDKLVVTDAGESATYTASYDSEKGELVFKNGGIELFKSNELYLATNQSYKAPWSVGCEAAEVRAVYYGLESDPVRVTIAAPKIEKPNIGNISFVYDGSQKIALASNDAYTVENGSATNAGTYSAVVKCNPGYVFTDDTTELSFDWTIEAAQIAVPVGKALTYNGKAQTGVAAAAGYAVSGNTATNAGEYTATLTCKPNYVFDTGETTEAVDWEIKPAKVAVPAGKTLTYNGKAQTGVAAGAGYTVEDGAETDAGAYEATAICDDNHVFATGDTEAYIDWEIKPASIAGATVALKKASAAYTGKTQSGAVNSVKLGSVVLKAGDYSVSAKSGKAVGSYAVTVTGEDNYTGTAKATFKITQAANSAKAAKTTVKKTIKLATVKKKAQTVALPKVTTKFGTAKWKVSTKDKKKVLTLKGNKIQVKKGAKKGTYTIKLKASVAKTKNYKAATSKVVTVKVTVK